MRIKKPLTCVVYLCLILTMVSLESRGLPTTAGQSDVAGDNTPTNFLKSLAGHWEGTCRTWFQPGKLADESKISGEFKLMLDGRFVRHTYSSAMKGNPRTGEETIVFNKIESEFEVYWLDSFHMNYAVLVSKGQETERGFSVSGKYRMAPDQPYWGWRTAFEMTDNDHLKITAYNVFPDGKEAKAVETVYERKSK